MYRTPGGCQNWLTLRPNPAPFPLPFRRYRNKGLNANPADCRLPRRNRRKRTSAFVERPRGQTIPIRFELMPRREVDFQARDDKRTVGEAIGGVQSES